MARDIFTDPRVGDTFLCGGQYRIIKEVDRDGWINVHDSAGTSRGIMKLNSFKKTYTGHISNIVLAADPVTMKPNKTNPFSHRRNIFTNPKVGDSWKYYGDSWKYYAVVYYVVGANENDVQSDRIGVDGSVTHIDAPRNVFCTWLNHIDSITDIKAVRNASTKKKAVSVPPPVVDQQQDLKPTILRIGKWPCCSDGAWAFLFVVEYTTADSTNPKYSYINFVPGEEVKVWACWDYKSVTEWFSYKSFGGNSLLIADAFFRLYNKQR